MSRLRLIFKKLLEMKNAVLTKSRNKKELRQRWAIELDGMLLGELIDPKLGEMFWISYQISPANKEAEKYLYNTELWRECRFQYRNIGLNKYAKNAFTNGPNKSNNRISMRGLYL